LAPHTLVRPPAVARAVARRIDRLARRAHAFHRFAHHPLCDRYASELISLGRRTRVCRGCTLLLLGSLCGVVVASVLQPSFAVCAACLVPAAGPMLVSLRWPRHLRSAGAKLGTRALPAAALGACLGAAASASLVALSSFVAAAALLASVTVFVYRRRGPDRAACAHCEERTQATPCSGFREIVRAERAFQRRAGQLLRAQGPG
jgi:hypothetical protein